MIITTVYADKGKGSLISVSSRSSLRTGRARTAVRQVPRPAHNLQGERPRLRLRPQWHHAPDRQYIILLEGHIEIEVSDGEKRAFSGGT
ncbi:MAG: hypothetical protein R3B51_07185 [Thermodesulfobacteriota bacterium]